jgi:RNA polymerase sigma-70 factor (sigma-E family)
VTATRRTRAAAPHHDGPQSLHDPAPPASTPEISFDDLYRASYARMVRLAWLLVGSRPAAEDVAHDAFLAVHQRWASVANPGGYLRRTVVNQALRTQRRRAGEQRALAGVGEPPPTGDPAIDSMWDAIARLRPDRRTVVVLRYWADLPHAEIAEVLRCPVATVRTRLHRALSDLRTEVSR